MYSRLFTTLIGHMADTLIETSFVKYELWKDLTTNGVRTPRHNERELNQKARTFETFN